MMIQKALFLLALFAVSAFPQAVRFDSISSTTNSQCAPGVTCPLLVIPGTQVNFCSASGLGVVNTAGTVVTLVSGPNFTGASGAVQIAGNTFQISVVVSSSVMVLTTSAGTQTNATYSTLSGCLSAPATTYTDGSAGTSCPTTAQLTPATGGACTSTADNQGNYGGWFVPGLYFYYLATPATAGGIVRGPYPFSIGAAAGCQSGATCDANYGTLSAAFSAAGSGTIYITRVWNGQTTATYTAVPQFLGNNARIQPGSGQTVTLPCPVALATSRIFDISLGGSIAFNTPCSPHVSWYYSGSGDAAPAINATGRSALGSGGTALYASPGAAYSLATLATIPNGLTFYTQGASFSTSVSSGDGLDIGAGSVVDTGGVCSTFVASNSGANAAVKFIGYGSGSLVFGGGVKGCLTVSGNAIHSCLFGDGQYQAKWEGLRCTSNNADGWGGYGQSTNAGSQISNNICELCLFSGARALEFKLTNTGAVGFIEQNSFVTSTFRNSGITASTTASCTPNCSNILAVSSPTGTIQPGMLAFCSVNTMFQQYVTAGSKVLSVSGSGPYMVTINQPTNIALPASPVTPCTFAWPTVALRGDEYTFTGTVSAAGSPSNQITVTSPGGTLIAPMGVYCGLNPSGALYVPISAGITAVSGTGPYTVTLSASPPSSMSGVTCTFTGDNKAVFATTFSNPDISFAGGGGVGPNDQNGTAFELDGTYQTQMPNGESSYNGLSVLTDQLSSTIISSMSQFGTYVALDTNTVLMDNTPATSLVSFESPEFVYHKYPPLNTAGTANVYLQGVTTTISAQAIQFPNTLGVSSPNNTIGTNGSFVIDPDNRASGNSGCTALHARDVAGGVSVCGSNGNVVLPTVSASCLNCSLGDGGMNNAITFTLPNPPPQAGGLCALVGLVPFTFQAGANTANYNGNGNAPVKKASNGGNLTTALSGFTNICFDGTNWEVMSQ